MNDIDINTLSNGISVIHKQVSNTKIAHCGLMLDIGSRDEKENQHGIAHFWEHMAFKGTSKRNSYFIVNRIDSIGGELNAFTTKEKIVFYVSVLDKYFERAVELLADITFNSIFPENQIQREKKVILEEMSMYYDSPDDALQDEFDEIIFSNHSLGKNILGSGESVNSFTKNDFINFIKENLDTEKVIFSSVSNLPFKKVSKIAYKHLHKIPYYSSKNNRNAFNNYVKENKIVKRDLTQSHCAIGTTAYSLTSNKKISFALLTNILGGYGMNTRLNLSLREKYGFVYAIDAIYQSFTDTGLFAIFFGTDVKQVDKCTTLVFQELKKLREKPLGIMQLHNAKQQFMGQLAMAEENNSSLMIGMAKSFLDLAKFDSLNTIFQIVSNITSQELQNISNEVFDENKMSSLTFLPK